jgi:hypothetical protein
LLGIELEDFRRINHYPQEITYQWIYLHSLSNVRIENEKNAQTGRLIKIQKLAIGEILDVRELGTMKTQTKKMKALSLSCATPLITRRESASYAEPSFFLFVSLWTREAHVI